jgi:hypothetical protein
MLRAFDELRAALAKLDKQDPEAAGEHRTRIASRLRATVSNLEGEK